MYTGNKKPISPAGTKKHMPRNHVGALRCFGDAGDYAILKIHDGQTACAKENRLVGTENTEVGQQPIDSLIGGGHVRKFGDDVEEGCDGVT